MQFKETYVQRALARQAEPTYLEIGVRHGDSLRSARARRKIAIDPVRSPQMRKLRPGEEFYQCTSDDFFTEHASAVLAATQIDVALVDGLHEFEQTYRDVYNLRAHMSPTGVIVLDDCNPPSEERASRTPTTGLWNGDVWKVMAVLNRALPPSKVATIDADQGIGIVMDFTTDWPEPDSGLVQEIAELDYAHLAANRVKMLGLVSPDSFSF